MNDKLKLRILALPSQTTLLFSSIIIVVLAAVAASNLPGAPMSAAPPLVLILVTLIIRDFLMQPEREIKSHELRSLRIDKYPRLMNTVVEIASISGFAPAPQLMITVKTPSAIFAFGSFRRAYIGLGEKLAIALERDLGSSVAAIREAAMAALEHEFQHLNQRDVIAVGLARSTLKVGALFMLWSAMFLVGMATASFAFPLTDFFSPAFMQRLTDLNPQVASLIGGFLTPELAEKVKQGPSWGLAIVYVLNAHLPIFYTTALLLLTVWRRLLRIRELYADAATANSHRAASAMRSALLRYSVVASLQPSSAPRRWVDKALPLGGPKAVNRWWAHVGSFLGFHPSLEHRKRGLAEPVSALADPHAIGVTAGVLVLLLDLMLISPFTLAYVTEVPGLIAVLVGFTAISWGLLPILATDSRETRRPMTSILISVGWIILIRTGFHLMNLAFLWAMVFLAPQYTTVILDSFALSVAGILRDTTHIVNANDLVSLAVEATAFALYLPVLIGITLVAILLADWQLKRLILTWYSFPNSRRWLNRIWWVGSATIALGAGCIWLPIINSLVPFTASFGFSLTEAVLIGLSMITLVGVAGVSVWLHRRFGRRCPRCRKEISSWFYLGKQCQQCSEALHPWLQAQY